LILDLDDSHWRDGDYFTDDELEELENFGEPLLQELPESLQREIQKIKELVNQKTLRGDKDMYVLTLICF
jgi:hypothetical protein